MSTEAAGILAVVVAVVLALLAASDGFAEGLADGIGNVIDSVFEKAPGEGTAPRTRPTAEARIRVLLTSRLGGISASGGVVPLPGCARSQAGSDC